MSISSSFKKSSLVVKTTNYVPYYDSAATILNGYKARLKSGVELTVSYVESSDSLKIISCKSKKSAVGKFIIDSKNLKIINKSSSTTEASSSSSSNSFASTDNYLYMDDSFVDDQYTSFNEYNQKLSNGLEIRDIRAILGMPHQFLPVADPRISSTENFGGNDKFGRIFAEKIIKHIPLLLITPGVPSFMAEYSNDQKKQLLSLIGESNKSTDSLFGTKKGKYYSLKYAYVDYFHYVNAMLRSAAIFLDIQDVKIDGKKLGTMNWLYSTSSMGSNVFTHARLADFLGPYAGCIAICADCGTSVDESFSNSTTESQLSSAMNNLSDTGREMNFLLGNVGAEVGLNTDFINANGLMSAAQEGSARIENILGGKSVFSSILGKATNILAGGRLVFPEIWSDSSFSRSYSCNMKLVSPSGDKLSIFLNILVPLYHILALAWPRESVDQAYFSPFLVRAYSKGLFNVDMGIITGLSVSKGEEGEWTLDGLPTVANISFEIKDLYNDMYMSKQESESQYTNIMSNIQELDYIANTCGININDQEVMRTAKLYITLGFSNVKDKFDMDIFGNISQYFNQRIQNIFGKF